MPYTSQPDLHHRPASSSLEDAAGPRASGVTTGMPPAPSSSRRRSTIRRRGVGVAVMSAGAAALVLGFQSARDRSHPDR